MSTDTLTQPAMTQHTLRLSVPRAKAMREIQAALKIGQAIADQRIRERHELDQARAEKQEWVQRTTELLTQLFNSSRVADRCNDWTARILPEYAPLEAFIDLFHQEMEHRLNRLRAVLRRLDDLPDSRTTVHAAVPDAPDDQPESPQQTPMTTTLPPVVTQPAPAPAPTMPASASRTLCLLLNCGGEATLEQSIRTFAQQLGLTVQPIARGEGIAAMEALDPDRQAGFAIVLAGGGEQTIANHLFELGFCTGRLGATRVCVMHDGASTFTAPQGLKALAVDGSEGWQLQLARLLKRAGVEIDLNRLL